MDAVNAHIDAFLRAGSAYCHRCGTPLERIDIGPSKKGERQYRVSCPGCGWESKVWNPSASTTRSDIRMVPLTSDTRPEGFSKGRWAQWIRNQRLSQLSISEKIQRLTFPAYVIPPLEPRLLLKGYWFGEGVKRIRLPAPPAQKVRVLSRMAREAIRKGPERATRMSDVLIEEQARREPDARYVKFLVDYEGPEYDAAIEQLRLEEADDRAPQGFGKPRTVLQGLRSQLVNFVIYGPPGANRVDFHSESNRYLNEFAIANAPVARVSASLRSGETVIWDIRRFTFPAPLAHAYAHVGHCILNVAAVGPIANDLEQVLPAIMRLEPHSDAALNLERGQAAMMQHRMNQVRERQAQQEKATDPSQHPQSRE